uniref:ATP-dependent DNA helicase n=1 Tax=Romanomermis culicivorax TaxID=13658 RepID=A0A915KA48_ROMCU
MACTSTGIAARLLMSAQAANSTFLIMNDIRPIQPSTMVLESVNAQKLCSMSLFIMDKISMLHRNAFEYFDGIMQSIQYWDAKPQPFNGIVFLIGGEFKQLLPVVPSGLIQNQIHDSSRLLTVGGIQLGGQLYDEHCPYMSYISLFPMPLSFLSTPHNTYVKLGQFLVKAGTRHPGQLCSVQPLSDEQDRDIIARNMDAGDDTGVIIKAMIDFLGISGIKALYKLYPNHSSDSCLDSSAKEFTYKHQKLKCKIFLLLKWFQGAVNVDAFNGGIHNIHLSIHTVIIIGNKRDLKAAKVIMIEQTTLYNHLSSSKNLVLLHHLLNPLELLMFQLQKKKLRPSDAIFYALTPKMPLSVKNECNIPTASTAVEREDEDVILGMDQDTIFK